MSCGSSNCIGNLFIIYLFLFKRNYPGTFVISRNFFSNVIINNFISLVRREIDTDSENVSLVWHSISDGQETCSSKSVSLISM